MTNKYNAFVKQAFANAAKDSNSEFCAIPTPALKELIIRNEHHLIKPMNDIIKKTFLFCTEDQGIGPIDKIHVLKYLFEDLDEGNTFILDHCDLRVVGPHGLGTKQNITE